VSDEVERRLPARHGTADDEVIVAMDQNANHRNIMSVDPNARNGLHCKKPQPVLCRLLADWRWNCGDRIIPEKPLLDILPLGPRASTA
jgi:hypothetical protein